LKSKDNVSPFRIVRDKDTPVIEPKSQPLDASVLAKLAEDVIAWNRPLNPSEVESGARPARVARLDSLRCGLKILRKEESEEGELRSIFKE
jgi:hypothetical protein